MNNNRVVTDADIKKYEPMVEMYIRKRVVKNWSNETPLSPSRADSFLGNTGWTVEDVRQYLKQEVVIALQHYDPQYRTKTGASVKESTLVYLHLSNRCGQLMKKLVKPQYGYGVRINNIEEVLHEREEE
jgi:hypothetical protein